MDELKKTTWKAALAVGAAVLMLFICIFRVSNVTTLVILVNVAILAIFSVVSTSWLRYLVLAVLTGGLAFQLVIRHEGSGLFIYSVLIRFVITGLLITYFATLLSQTSQRLYFDMENLASEREEALHRSHQMLGQLNALVGVITAIGKKGMKASLRDIFAESLEETRKVFNADSGLIYSVDRKNGKLSIVSSFGYSDTLLEKMKARGVSDASLCPACSGSEAVAVDNLATGEKCSNLAKVQSGSSVCVPIRTKNNIWGVMHLRRRNPAAFTKEDIQLASAMAFQFAIAMQRAYLLEQLNLQAITDPLTGLFNYRKMTRDLRREIVRSIRYHHPFSFVMADIDHFKDFNDQYGHQAGDVVLREVAGALDSGRREVDRVYRYGGEEFSILLPETDWSEALEVAEKLRNKVESLGVDVNGQRDPLSVTLSFGVASFPQDGEDTETLTSAADEALYVAKENGRNQVASHAGLSIDAEDRAHPGGIPI